MKEKRIASADTGAANKSNNRDGSRSGMVEYVFAQFEFDDSNFARNSLNETKPRLEKTGPDKNS